MNPKDQITSEAFEALKVYMVQEYRAKIVSGGREILKRCHFCGDSRDPSNAHMYIGMSNGLIVYNCFKCNAKGLVDYKFLKDLGCYNIDIINLCQDQNNKNSNSSSRYGNLDKRISSRFFNMPTCTDEFGVKKLEYLSNRMGHIFNIFDAAKFKIVLNLKDYLTANGISQYTRHPDMIELLNNFFIGFLSIDNNYIILRRLVDEGKLPKYIDHRYINYNIFGNPYEGLKYYSIPSIVNPNLPIDIHIAEGAFDILSIYLHVAPIGTNGIFAAISGNSYISLIRFFIINYGFTSFNLHLYPDSDVGIDKMMRIKEDLKPFNIRLFIHRNTSSGEKDFGVSMDRIIDSIYEI